jgi:glycosyltransferase involved in cell wall biosynthesis
MNIRISGQLGNTHSLTIANQFQLIEFAHLYPNQDLAFDQRVSLHPPEEAGFYQSDIDKIASIRRCEPTDKFDVSFQIYGDHRDQDIKTIKYNFFVSEVGNLIDGLRTLTDREEHIIVPSRWVKDMIEYKIGINKNIHLIPQGVNTRYFYPLSEDQRNQIRKRIGINPEIIIFSNIGAMTYNKGIDIILKAFGTVAKLKSDVCLILKDSRNIYGIEADYHIKMALEQGDIDTSTIERIRLLRGHLRFNELNQLYNISDFYISPYRGEGFNMPVLEALASGAPSIIPTQGPTIDFTDQKTSVYVESEVYETKDGRLIAVDEEHLVASMCNAINDINFWRHKGRSNAHAQGLKFTYSHFALKLLATFAAEHAALSNH